MENFAKTWKTAKTSEDGIFQVITCFFYKG